MCDRCVTDVLKFLNRGSDLHKEQIDVDILNNVMTLFYGQIWSAEFKYYCDTDNKCAKSVCIPDRFGHR
jgi:hypothetical protein